MLLLRKNACFLTTSFCFPADADVSLLETLCLPRSDVFEAGLEVVEVYGLWPDLPLNVPGLGPALICELPVLGL